MWLIQAIVSALFAGATSILAKIGIRKVDTNLSTALQTAVVLVFSWSVVLCGGLVDQIADVSARDLALLALSGLATGACWLCYFNAVQLGRVGSVAAVNKMSTPLTIVMAAALLGEAFGLLQLLCIVSIGAGTLLMSQRDTAADTVALQEKGGKKWLVYAALAAFFSSVSSILSKLGLREIDPNLATALRTVAVAALCWLVVLARGDVGKKFRAMDRKSLCYIALAGLVTGLSWMFFYWALRTGPVSVVSPIERMSLIFTALFAHFALGERLTIKMVVGLVLIVAGTVLLVIYQ